MRSKDYDIFLVWKVLKWKKEKNIALSLNKWWNSFKGLWHRNWCIYTFFAVANWKFLKLKWPCSLKIATEHNWTMHCNFPLVWNDIVLFLLGHDGLLLHIGTFYVRICLILYFQSSQSTPSFINGKWVVWIAHHCIFHSERNSFWMLFGKPMKKVKWKYTEWNHAKTYLSAIPTLHSCNNHYWQ